MDAPRASRQSPPESKIIFDYFNYSFFSMSNDVGGGNAEIYSASD
jgi:hypothetical protein